MYEPSEKEVSAGGIVFRQSTTGISVAMMKDSYDKWTFPKGHVENGESFEEAGARETLEELGLQEIRFLDSLGKISIWFRDRFEKKGKLIHKDIHYYLFQTPMNARLYPDPTQNAYGAKWIPLAKVEQMSGYADLLPIIRHALEILKTKGDR